MSLPWETSISKCQLLVWHHQQPKHFSSSTTTIIHDAHPQMPHHHGHPWPPPPTTLINSQQPPLPTTLVNCQQRPLTTNNDHGMHTTSSTKQSAHSTNDAPDHHYHTDYHTGYPQQQLVFAGPVHRTEKNRRTELNRTMVWSIFRLRLLEFGAILVAGCRVSKIF